MSKFEEIKDYLEDEGDLFELYNDYCQKTNRCDDMIFTMDEFDEQMDGFSPWEIASKIWNGDFNPNHDCWKFDGYANLQSFWDVYNAVDINELARYIVENEDSLGDDDIQKILDNDEEE